MPVILPFSLLALAACQKNKGDSGPELVSARWRFPDAASVSDGHLDLIDVPVASGGTPLPLDRLAFRSGFSPVQTSVIAVELALDPTSLPGPEAEAGTGSVQIWDLDSGLPVRAFAEIDASPYLDAELPTLLVRPLEPMISGHRVAVVVTGDLRTAEGESLAAEAIDAALAERLRALGVADPVLAWDFPIDDGADLLAGLVASVEVPSTWTWTEQADVDLGDTLPARTWRQLSGTFTVQSWLGESGAFSLDGDGAPLVEADAQASLFVHVPESVRGAPAGSVPVWIFGHGIFSSPEHYLADLEDPSAVVEVADRAGAILLATEWRGLTLSDLGTVLAVGHDFGKLPRITDALSQSVANQVALERLALEGGLLDDPAFEGLPDKSQLLYYGISLGAIEGAVLQAHDDTIPYAVLHAGGAAWSTLLERSYAWSTVESLVVDTVPSGRDRQQLLALSQLFWDPIDPGALSGRLTDKHILWQECMGDEYVSNLATNLLLRGVGAVALEPVLSLPEGLGSAVGPLGGPVFSQADPELGVPANSNRPAELTGAHTTPRTWEGVKAQTLRFLDADDPGHAEHFCGDSPCTAENPG